MYTVGMCKHNSPINGKPCPFCKAEAKKAAEAAEWRARSEARFEETFETLKAMEARLKKLENDMKNLPTNEDK